MDSNSKKTVRRRLVRSYITSVISIALVLVMVAAVAVFASNAGNIARYFKEHMSVSVILKQSVSEKEARAVHAKFSKEPYVKSSRYISKEQGAEEMEALLGEDFLDVFESSPIPISIDLNLDGDAITKDSLNVIRTRLMQNDFVEDVVYQESLVEALNSNLDKIAVVLGIVILLLTIISFALIGNTIRLDIYARRFTIHTMSLVGARRSFIARPFVIQAVVVGLVSGLLACLATAGMLIYSGRDSDLLWALLDKNIVIAALCGTLVLGVVICVLSSLFVVRKVAYISKDDLYY